MLKRFQKDESGNVAILFGMTMTMLLFAVGAAIDVSSAVSQKGKLQEYSDAAVLAAVASGEEEPQAIKKIVRDMLETQNTEQWDLDWDVVIEGNTVTVVANTEYDTQLLGFAGYNKMDFKVLSQALMPEDIPINISLVLDRTGSMSGDNMTALKSASAKLVDIFSNYEDDTRVAVVPFAEYVNVGMDARNETWIDVPADATVTIPAGECYDYTPRTCTGGTTPETQTRYNDGVPYEVTVDVCNGWTDEPVQNYCPPERTEVTEWRGCIGSRDGEYNKTAAYKGKRIPGIMNESCGEEVLPLTTDMNSVKAKIDSLTATNEQTYIPVGLINGWRMLDADKPWDSLSNKEEKRKRALVLMSDGKNTKSLTDPYNGTHTGNDEDAANAISAVLCNNIKEAGIDIYAVAYKFSSGDDKAKDVIRHCASSSSQFFDAQSPEELEAAFDEIGNSLFEVRLTR